jgi:hypothetical protein
MNGMELFLQIAGPKKISERIGAASRNDADFPWSFSTAAQPKAPSGLRRPRTARPGAVRIPDAKTSAADARWNRMKS